MELLIKAKEPWNNNADTSGMTEDELKDFNSRSRLGDIIVVRPDGWTWGNAECLPDFIVVKIPGVNPPANYESMITEDVDPAHPEKGFRILKRRKFQVPAAYMARAIADGNSTITIELSAKKTQFINNIIEKMS